MQSYLENNSVTLTFPVSGSPTQVRYRVVDEMGTELVPLTTITPTPTTTATVTIPADKNLLPTGKQRAARMVELLVTTAAGTTSDSKTYRITGQNRLEVPSYSFQSLASADLIASEMVDTSYWDTATTEEKIAALIESRNRLCQYSYSKSFDPDDIFYRMTRVVGDFYVSDLDEFDLTQFTALPELFKSALRLAQVAEANALLRQKATVPDTLKDGGLTLTTRRVGEAEDSYTTSNPASSAMGLSGDALKILSPYLGMVTSRRIGRA